MTRRMRVGLHQLTTFRNEDCYEGKNTDDGMADEDRCHRAIELPGDKAAD